MKFTKGLLKKIIAEECAAMEPMGPMGGETAGIMIVGGDEHDMAHGISAEKESHGPEEIEGLATRAMAAIHDLATAAGVELSTTVDTEEDMMQEAFGRRQLRKDRRAARAAGPVTVQSSVEDVMRSDGTGAATSTIKTQDARGTVQQQTTRTPEGPDHTRATMTDPEGKITGERRPGVDFDLDAEDAAGTGQRDWQTGGDAAFGSFAESKQLQEQGMVNRFGQARRGDRRALQQHMGSDVAARQAASRSRGALSGTGLEYMDTGAADRAREQSLFGRNVAPGMPARQATRSALTMDRPTSGVARRQARQRSRGAGREARQAAWQQPGPTNQYRSAGAAAAAGQGPAQTAPQFGDDMPDFYQNEADLAYYRDAPGYRIPDTDSAQDPGDPPPDLPGSRGDSSRGIDLADDFDDEGFASDLTSTLGAAPENRLALDYGQRQRASFGMTESRRLQEGGKMGHYIGPSGQGPEDSAPDSPGLGTGGMAAAIQDAGTMGAGAAASRLGAAPVQEALKMVADSLAGATPSQKRSFVVDLLDMLDVDPSDLPAAKSDLGRKRSARAASDSGPLRESRDPFKRLRTIAFGSYGTQRKK